MNDFNADQNLVLRALGIEAPSQNVVTQWEKVTFSSFRSAFATFPLVAAR